MDKYIKINNQLSVKDNYLISSKQHICFKSKRVIKTLTNLQKQNKEELKNYKYIYY